MDSNGPKTVTALWAMTGISIVFIAVRFYCKYISTRRLGIDDGILLVAWVFTLVYSSLITISVSYGLGDHKADIKEHNKVPMYKYMFLGEFFSLISLPTSKTSFAVTLLRIATKRWQKYSIWFVIITMNATLWICGLLLFFQCSPIEKNWNKAMAGTCWKSKVQDDYSIFAGAYSAALDFFLASFPCLMIWNLQISGREKAGVIIAMSFGYLAGITAAVKTSFLPGIGGYKDITYQLANLLIWSNAEAAVTIVAACIPFYRVLIKKVRSYNSAQKNGNSYRLGSYNGRNPTVGTGRSRKGRGLETEMGEDDLSERSILGEAVRDHGAIVKSSEVTIEYTEDKTGRSHA
ncbi:hypothetical protein P154DRAFT_155404 [Amniculicola lignicola CBS 123094]|uniref:Rhodopsin domain-containing protein n=1 Tax=Amniculicola lignicola CBS 123094 TaxID=1392246 RepID=A0A6A5WJA2_9PLEO|nr:hypothetical protein P154DRAFT_155404 [Amniculicola lignicola CBS 123094]